MSVTSSTDIISREILADAVAEALKGKTGLIDSIFVSQGAIWVDGTMPKYGPSAIGTTIRLPFWGIMGDFVSRTESQSPTRTKVAQTYEDATIVRASASFEISRWARGQAEVSGQEDPYTVMSRQIALRARRWMDLALITAGHGSPLVYDLYSATAPHYLVYTDVVTGKAQKLGDEQGDGIVAMALHSLIAADLANQVDSTGRPILTDAGAGNVTKVAGVPVIQSDRLPLTGSTMGTTYGPFTTVYGASAGTGSATVAISVTDVSTLGPWKMVIEVLSTGEAGAATIRFSTDGGNTWSAALTTAATTVALELTDTAVDSLVGNNGATGCSLTVTSGAGDDLVDGEYYWACPNLCCESQVWMKGAGAYWYNEQAMELLTDQDIEEDTIIGAMHIYGVAHCYRRRNSGTRPGVLRFKTNARGFVG
jgi:hypothetical protein